MVLSSIRGNKSERLVTWSRGIPAKTLTFLPFDRFPFLPERKGTASQRACTLQGSPEFEGNQRRDMLRRCFFCPWLCFTIQSRSCQTSPRVTHGAPFLAEAVGCGPILLLLSSQHDHCHQRQQRGKSYQLSFRAGSLFHAALSYKWHGKGSLGHHICT